MLWRDKIQARWDTTDSENEDSTSYIIQFPDNPSSQYEFEEPWWEDLDDARSAASETIFGERVWLRDCDSSFYHFWGKLIS